MSIADPSTWPRASKGRLTAWRKLKTRKGRRESGQLVVEGVRLVTEALQSGCRVDVLIAADDAAGHGSATRVISGAGDWDGQVVRVASQEMRAVTDTVHTSGIAAVISWRANEWDDAAPLKANRILFCDAISDPGNLGTLIRTAAGLGLDAVIVGPDSVEPSNPKTARASAGAIFRIPVIRARSVADFLEWSLSEDYPIFIADAGHGAAEIGDRQDIAGRWILVIGGETTGLSSEWDVPEVQRVRIPMGHQVESLNAAVAGAILMDRLSGRGVKQ